MLMINEMVITNRKMALTIPRFYHTHRHTLILRLLWVNVVHQHLATSIHVRIENPGSILIQLHNVFNVSACVCVCAYEMWAILHFTTFIRIMLYQKRECSQLSVCAAKVSKEPM